MNTQTQPSGLPSLLDVLCKELSPAAAKVLVTAFDTKRISTGEIANLFEGKARKSQAFLAGIRALTAVFREYGITVSYSAYDGGLKKSNQRKGEIIPRSEMIPTEQELLSIDTRSADTSDERPFVSLPKVITPTDPFVLEIEQSGDRTEERKLLCDGDNLYCPTTAYMEMSCNHSILDEETVVKLIGLAQKGDISARNLILVHNQKLVFSVARKIYSRHLDITDRAQEGNFGMIRAIEKFDASFGVKFSTYAMWWIRQSIFRAVQDKQDTIRIPVHIQDGVAQMKKIIALLTRELGREITEKEILDGSKNLKKPKRLLRILNQSMVSIDAKIDDNNESSRTIGDSIISESELLPNRSLEAKEVLNQKSENIRDLVSTVLDLPIRERNKEIFFMYHGLQGKKRMVLEEIGQIMGMTRERVRQINAIVWDLLHQADVVLDADSIWREMPAVHEMEKVAHTEVTS